MFPRPPSSTLFPYTTLFRSYHWDPSIRDSVRPPRIYGHEFCGFIEKFGNRAHREDLHEGDFVSAETKSPRSEEHTSELQSRLHLVCRLLLEKKKTNKNPKQK